MFLSALPGLEIDPASDLNRKFVGKLISIVERTIKEMGSSLSGQNVEALYKVVNQVKGFILERRGSRETRWVLLFSPLFSRVSVNKQQ